MNGGSVLGHFGKDAQKVSMSLLEQRVVHFIASDAHSPEGRTFVLRRVFEFLKDKLPEDYLTNLFYANQRNIIDEIRIEKVQLPQEEKPQGLFNKLKKRFK